MIAILTFMVMPSPGQDFVDVADLAGLDQSRYSNSVTAADYDNDGDLDIYTVSALKYRLSDPNTWNRLYRNNGDGTYSDVTDLAGVQSRANSDPVGVMGKKMGAAWGDYDNDGHLDLLLSNFGFVELFRNNGDGTFSEVAANAGLITDPASMYTSSLWLDIDLDGDLDLHLCSYTRTNQLFENLGDGTFLDITTTANVGNIGNSFTILPIDANNDRWPDIYLANDYGGNELYINNGDKTFTRRTGAYGVGDDGNGMGAALGDFDNNGFFDIYITNIGNLFPNPLFFNTGLDTFLNRAIEFGVNDAGWAWGTEFLDFDNDRDLDLYAVNGWGLQPGNNFFYRNTLESGTLGFNDISASCGADGSREARGLLVFDYDVDGDLDMLVANITNAPYLYQNQSNSGNWVQLKLEGVTVNRQAVGAVVKLRHGSDILHRIHDGADFFGQSVVPVHFGLGDWDSIDEIVVEWPGAAPERFSNMPINQVVTLREGSGSPVGFSDLSHNFIEGFELLSNYPNPFNGSTNIRFTLPRSGEVAFQLYNIQGQLLYQRQTQMESGTNELRWEGRNQSGQTLSSGQYYYRIRFENAQLNGSLLFVK